MKPTILLDCDGVLANFCAGFLDSIEEETGYRYGEAAITDWSITRAPFFVQLAEDLALAPTPGVVVGPNDAGEYAKARPEAELAKRVWKRVNRIGWCSNLPTIAGAKEAVDALRELAQVEVVTSPLGSSATWMPERVEWLQRHFGFATEDIHFIQKKWRIRGDMLVDDKPSHISEWKEAFPAGCAFLWDQPYNREGHEGMARACTWDTVVQAAAGMT